MNCFLPAFIVSAFGSRFWRTGTKKMAVYGLKKKDKKKKDKPVSSALGFQSHVSNPFTIANTSEKIVLICHIEYYILTYA